MKYQLEKLRNCIEEISRLSVAHHFEISKFTDFDPDTDWETYIALEEQHGLLRVFTARDDKDVLRGYCAFHVAPSLHYKGLVQAHQDLIWIQPEFRGQGLGKKFIGWIDEKLKEEGIHAVIHNVPAVSPESFTYLLKDLDYEFYDSLYIKRLNINEHASEEVEE